MLVLMIISIVLIVLSWVVTIIQLLRDLDNYGTEATPLVIWLVGTFTRIYLIVAVCILYSYTS